MQNPGLKPLRSDGHPPAVQGTSGQLISFIKSKSGPEGPLSREFTVTYFSVTVKPNTETLPRPATFCFGSSGLGRYNVLQYSQR